ncbi:hypothetical protein ACHAXR_007261 [Thalassiosira sp. AJA248-18]
MPTSKPTSSRIAPSRVVAVIILIVTIISVALSGVFSKDSATSDFDLFDPSTWIPRWLDDNPHGGDTPYDFNTWDTQRSCKGLELHIINNLDDQWQPYFERSIDDWENGEPDVLTLHVRKPVFHDPGCEPSQGVMKVCNAMMNDYHLNKMSKEAKQNTMCHELGHGLGLGHWDEDFFNRDLGNCMDYTKTPENNQAPDRSNFLFLEQMYGNVDGTSRYSSNVNGTEGLHCTSTNSGTEEIFKQRKLTENAGLAADEFSRYARLLSKPLPTIENPEMSQRYLKRNDHEEIRERIFANGMKIVSTTRLVS